MSQCSVDAELRVFMYVIYYDFSNELLTKPVCVCRYISKWEANCETYTVQSKVLFF